MEEYVFCRICLFSHKSDESRNLFSNWKPPWIYPEEVKVTQTIADVLGEMSNTEICENDSFPQGLCKSCFHQFSKSCLFIHRVRLSDRVIKKHDYFLHSTKKEEEPCDDVPMTISTGLQLSKIQYDNLEPAETSEKIPENFIVEQTKLEQNIPEHTAVRPSVEEAIAKLTGSENSEQIVVESSIESSIVKLKESDEFKIEETTFKSLEKLIAKSAGSEPENMSVEPSLENSIIIQAQLEGNKPEKTEQLASLAKEDIENSMEVTQELSNYPVIADKGFYGRQTLVWKNEEELTKFMASYTPDWINCKDVYTSTEDFVEYLGVKCENEDENSSRMMNGFHSEEMFDADQIKLEPDANGRLTNYLDRDGSPIMETEWLEDFKSETSDSETVDTIPQECILCSRRFQTISGLKAHVISSHSYRTVFRISVNSLRTVEQTEVKSSCPADKWCKYCNIRVDSFARHLYEVKHTIKKCSWCESTFGNDRLMYTHTLKCRNRHRGINGTANIGPVKDKIETGQEDVHRVARLGTNISLLNDASVHYKCKYCSESFVNSEYLNIHTQAYHSPSSHDDGGDDLEAMRLEINQGQIQQT